MSKLIAIKIKIPSHQYQRLADFMQDAGQVSAASIAIPYLLNDFRPTVALTGIAFTFFFLALSYLLNENSI